MANKGGRFAWQSGSSEDGSGGESPHRAAPPPSAQQSAGTPGHPTPQQQQQTPSSQCSDGSWSSTAASPTVRARHAEEDRLRRAAIDAWAARRGAQGETSQQQQPSTSQQRQFVVC